MPVECVQKTISGTPKKVGRLETIGLVEESGEQKVITVVAQKDDQVCVVFLASLPQQWADNQPRFRRSLDSLSMR